MSGRGFNLQDYAKVDDRITNYWAMHPKPEGSIQTEIVWVSDDGNSVAIRATVYQGDRILATGIAQEERGPSGANRTSWWENAETSAIGRALANMDMSLSRQRPSRQEMEKVERHEAAQPGPARNAAPAFAAPRAARFPSEGKPAETMTLEEVKREIAPLEQQARRNDDALSNQEYARYNALNARREALLAETPKAAPAPAPASPLPRLTEAELTATIDQAWANAEDGWALGAIRDDLNRQRHRMSKEQMDRTRDELAKIEAKFYAPASIAG